MTTDSQPTIAPPTASEALLELAEDLAGAMSRQAVIEAVLRHGRAVTDADVLLLTVVDDDDPTQQVRRISPSQAIGEANDGSSLVLATESALLAGQSMSLDHGSTEVLLLKRSGTESGVVTLRYGAPELRPPQSLLDRFGRVVGRSLARASRFDDERRAAAVFQSALLPSVLPSIEGVRVSARYAPYDHRLGGDFYDVFVVDGDPILVIGDVSGHGIESSRTMAKVRSFLRAGFRAGMAVSEVVAFGNELLLAEEMGEMATVSVARIDRASGRIVVAAAGHEPPLIRGPGAVTQFLSVRPGPPLGAYPRMSYPTTIAPLEPGSLVLLYTDGLYESATRSLDDGLESLRFAVDEFTDGDDIDVVALTSRLVGGVASSERRDDIAVLAMFLEA